MNFWKEWSDLRYGRVTSCDLEWKTVINTFFFSICSRTYWTCPRIICCAVYGFTAVDCLTDKHLWLPSVLLWSIIEKVCIWLESSRSACLVCAVTKQEDIGVTFSHLPMLTGVDVTVQNSWMSFRLETMMRDFFLSGNKIENIQKHYQNRTFEWRGERGYLVGKVASFVALQQVGYQFEPWE